MKATISITDDNGLTVEVSASVPASSLSQLFSDSERESSTEDHAQSFHDVLLEMPSVLLQARDSICRNLLAASCNNLRKVEQHNA